MTWQNLELHSKEPYSTDKFSRVMGLNESRGEELILVIKEVFPVPENLPIHVATAFCETKSMRSQAKAVVSFLIIGPRAIVSLLTWLRSEKS